MSTAAAGVFRGCRALMSSSAVVAGGKKAESAAAAAAAKRKVSTDADAAASKQRRGITRPVQVSAALRDFIGAAHISRVGALHVVLDYIREHGLQNPVGQGEVICDEKLKSIFAGRDTVEVLEVTMLLSPHFMKTD